MEYISLYFYVFLISIIFFYYLLPNRIRWIVILFGNSIFYYYVGGKSFGTLFFMAFLTWLTGKVLEILDKKGQENRRMRVCVFMLSLVSILLPLFFFKTISFFERFGTTRLSALVMPIGISFYTLQNIAYIVDIYKKKINAESNFLKYFTFISFFPHVIQGPIAKYQQMQEELFKEHSFQERVFGKGILLIIYGFFMKMMIADKSAIIVNTIFSQSDVYVSVYVLIAALLYSIQLYIDFRACVTISQGVGLLMDIKVMDNFDHPYLSTSIKDFWRRWHISLSNWLREYIYIPLGGNRKGKYRKWLNILIVYILSGIWHGTGFKFLVWGFMHAIYQILGEIIMPFRRMIRENLGLKEKKCNKKGLETLVTFTLVMYAWIIFRANTLTEGINMILSSGFQNIEILYDGSLLKLGLDIQDCIILIISIIAFLLIELLQMRVCVSDWILNQNLIIRWSIYIIVIMSIVIFGTYGVGYNSQDFIYGGF